MKNKVTAFGVLLLLASCALAAVESAKQISVSPFERRIIADFSLGEVHEYPSGYIDERDLDAALKNRFPPGTTRIAVEQAIERKILPVDVVTQKEKDDCRVYYYEIENYERPRICRRQIRFRFSKTGLLERADFYIEHFYGGVTKEMPKALLERSNQ